MPIIWVIVALMAAAVWRTRYIRAITEIAARRTLGPDGIVVGGEGFTLQRADAPAVLLLHGGGDTPQTLRYLASALYASGYHVDAPLLPGHGRSISDFSRVSADALMHAARSRYDALVASHGWVGVIGLSMGGALAVQLAAEEASVPALGLVAPYLDMPAAIRRAARLARVWGAVVPAVRSADGVSIHDPEEQRRSLAYGVFTPAGLRALYDVMRAAAAALPRVTAPTLVVQSREDNRITVASAEHAFAELGASDKRMEWIAGAGHVITVDYGREHVIELLVAWMNDHRLADRVRS